MNHHITAQLAELRRQQLVADATVHGLARHRPVTRRAAQPTRRNPLHRPVVAFRAWLGAGQI